MIFLNLHTTIKRIHFLKSFLAFFKNQIILCYSIIVVRWGIIWGMMTHINDYIKTTTNCVNVFVHNML